MPVGTNDVLESLGAQELPVPGKAVAVQGAERVGRGLDAAHLRGPNEPGEPGRRARQIGETHRQRPERVRQPARNVSQHSWKGHRRIRVAAEEASVTERGAALPRRQRVEDRHLPAGSTQ